MIEKQAISNKREGARRTSKKSMKESEKGGIKKQYLKSNNTCRVTFRLPKEAALEAKSVTIVGDFNNWDKEATPMKRLKNGDFTVTLELQTDREYRFKYLIDGNRWENGYADRYEQNPYGSDDSVVVV